MQYIYSACIYILLLGVYACSSDFEAEEREEIKTYLAQNNILALDTLGVFVHIENSGGEVKPNATNTVKLRYIGRYLDSTIFDKTKDTSTVDLNLEAAISGLMNGLTFFGINGNGTIYIPSALGYGDSPPFGVRKNEILVYDVWVEDIIQ